MPPGPALKSPVTSASLLKKKPHCANLLQKFVRREPTQQAEITTSVVEGNKPSKICGKTSSSEKSPTPSKRKAKREQNISSEQVDTVEKIEDEVFLLDDNASEEKYNNDVTNDKSDLDQNIEEKENAETMELVGIKSSPGIVRKKRKFDDSTEKFLQNNKRESIGVTTSNETFKADNLTENGLEKNKRKNTAVKSVSIGINKADHLTENGLQKNKRKDSAVTPGSNETTKLSGKGLITAFVTKTAPRCQDDTFLLEEKIVEVEDCNVSKVTTASEVVHDMNKSDSSDSSAITLPEQTLNKTPKADNNTAKVSKVTPRTLTKVIEKKKKEEERVKRLDEKMQQKKEKEEEKARKEQERILLKKEKEDELKRQKEEKEQQREEKLKKKQEENE